MGILNIVLFILAPFLSSFEHPISEIIDFSRTFKIKRDVQEIYYEYQYYLQEKPLQRKFDDTKPYDFNDIYFISLSSKGIEICNAEQDTICHLPITDCQALQVSKRNPHELYIFQKHSILIYSLMTAQLVKKCALPRIIEESINSTEIKYADYPTIPKETKPIIETGNPYKDILFIKPYHWIYNQPENKIAHIAFNKKKLDDLTCNNMGTHVAIASHDTIQLYNIQDLSTPICEMQMQYSPINTLLIANADLLIAAVQQYIFIYQYCKQKLLKKICCEATPRNLRLSLDNPSHLQFKTGLQWREISLSL